MTERRTRGLGWVVGWAAVGTLFLSLAPPVGLRPAAAATIVVDDSFCGTTLDGNNTYILNHDVTCDTPTGVSGVGLTVEGPATLKLNNHTVTCDGIAIGVMLDGTAGTLLGPGRVYDCDEVGVILEGQGRHTVQGVSATHNARGGIVVESNINTLIGNTASFNAGSSTQCFEDDDADPAEGEGHGIEVGGSGNLLQKNVATDNGGDGFFLKGTANRLESSRADNNCDNGITFDSSQFGTGTGNSASHNGDTGIQINGEWNLLTHNTSASNGRLTAADRDGEGFKLEGSHNTLKNNKATKNPNFGIKIEAPCCGDDDPEDNVIIKNTVSGSGVTDMQDEIDDCVKNTWRGNVFGSKNRACIQ